uniref:Uncharacterized protein n=1 Tax=Haematobia irritans TaxID=7368 RepID=A0A1L8EIV3_HAEIR
MSLSSAPAVTMYPEEPQIFTSTFSIKLKPSTGHCIKINENTTFEWHTNVLTPPNSPSATQQSASEDEMIKKLSHAENQQAAKPSIPAFTYNEEDDLKTSLDKFMSCERYHSQHQKMYQQGTQL